MQRILLTALAVAAAIAVVAAIPFGDLAARLTAWAAAGQREFQNAMAGALRALRAGETGALGALCGVCFAYGFFHAAGPGHGKVLIGGYGLGRPVGLRRLSAIALAASLGQGLTAIALVGAGIVLFDLTRQGMVGITEETLAPVSYGLIVALGLWLVIRGLRNLWRAMRQSSREDGACATCGHRHAPDPEAAAKVTGWRDALVLIGSVALRPCTGALFLLILTWQMGIFATGVLGTLAMALGTASVTLAAAWGSVFARRGAVLAGGRAGALRLTLPALEVVAGLLVVVLTSSLLAATLS